MFNALCPTVYHQLRIRSGLTQAELGKRLGVSRITVVRFENGRAQPEKEQEEKLQELAQCSDEELAELICRHLSRRIGRRVGIHPGRGAYEPASALAKAYSLLEDAADEIPPAMARALHNKISTAQLLGLAFERTNADLVELTRDCLEPLNDQRREQAC